MTSESFPSKSRNNEQEKTKIAIVGGGVSGLAASYAFLQNTTKYTVDVFESASKLGGHAHTLTVHPKNEKVPHSSSGIDVDIGFMVYNDANYPNMTKWFDALNVEGETSDMSLSVSLDKGDTIEWSSLSILADKSQIFKPKYYSFLRDMMRFNADAVKVLLLDKDDPNRYLTTGAYLKREGYSEAFGTYYLLPMMAALWSASLDDVLDFPIAELVGFLCNHKMLQVFDRPTWKTPKGRSQSYTKAMHSLLGDHAHVNMPITKIHKLSDGRYELFSKTKMDNDVLSSCGVFDHIIFACHPHTIPSMFEEDSDAILPSCADSLRSVRYADNTIYVHSDERLMPKRKAAWASWNCLGKSDMLSSMFNKSSIQQEDDSDSSNKKKKKGNKLGSFEGGESGFGNKIQINGGHNDTDDTTTHDNSEDRMKAVYVTYYLNRLQNLQTDTDIFVSLNPHTIPSESLTYEKRILAHPQFTPETVEARSQILEHHQGTNNLWYCGAWTGYGFHEDGCRSGFEVACSIMKDNTTESVLPWGTVENPVLPPPDLALETAQRYHGSLMKRSYQFVSTALPMMFCKFVVCKFLRGAIGKGCLQLKFNDGSTVTFGDGSKINGCDIHPVVCRVVNDWFFVKIAMEYDLGMARAYMAGYFYVEPLSSQKEYDPILYPPNTRNETNKIIGDPIGLNRLFLLFIGNRDSQHNPSRSHRNHKTISNAFSNASGLFISQVGNSLNYLRYKLTMNNTENGGSLSNIHAHYNLSNDLFRTFLDKETLMYSSAIYDAVVHPKTENLVFRGTLEEAQVRKLDTLLSRAQIKEGMTFLDIGFGWGGLSIAAAQRGCIVHGITLSVEQKALAEERVKALNLQHLITFEVIDYRTFARQKINLGRFDRVLSCEMIEAVGHDHLGEFFWAVEQVLKPDGILVMEAITTPESRYETYLRSTDFINTIIFPGSCCPSLHALIDASYKESTLILEHIDNIGLHYARTLAEWRRRFNSKEHLIRKQLGFDDVFLRVWNYYLTYCEAAFHSQTENCLILVFARQGCQSLVPLCEARGVTQPLPLTEDAVEEWLKEGVN